MRLIGLPELDCQFFLIGAWTVAIRFRFDETRLKDDGRSRLSSFDARATRNPAQRNGRNGRKKRGAPNYDRSPNPRQGAQEQHAADAPRSHGELSTGTASCKFGPCGPVWRYLGEAEPTYSSFKLSSGWVSHDQSQVGSNWREFLNIVYRIAALR